MSRWFRVVDRTISAGVEFGGISLCFLSAYRYAESSFFGTMRQQLQGVKASTPEEAPQQSFSRCMVHMTGEDVIMTAVWHPEIV